VGGEVTGNRRDGHRWVIACREPSGRAVGSVMLWTGVVGEQVAGGGQPGAPVVLGAFKSHVSGGAAVVPAGRAGRPALSSTPDALNGFRSVP
jgi:hypothetical protein